MTTTELRTDIGLKTGLKDDAEVERIKKSNAKSKDGIGALIGLTVAISTGAGFNKSPWEILEMSGNILSIFP